MTAREAGRAAEELAAQFLCRKGWRLVARNYHCRAGEIDIIAQHGEYLIFVEVRARGVGSLLTPGETMTPSKRRKIIAAARHYLLHHPTDLQPRFDFIAVDMRAAEWAVDHLEGAFDGE